MATSSSLTLEDCVVRLEKLTEGYLLHKSDEMKEINTRLDRLEETNNTRLYRMESRFYRLEEAIMKIASRRSSRPPSPTTTVTAATAALAAEVSSTQMVAVSTLPAVTALREFAPPATAAPVVVITPPSSPLPSTPPSPSPSLPPSSSLLPSIIVDLPPLPEEEFDEGKIKMTPQALFFIHDYEDPYLEGFKSESDYLLKFQILRCDQSESYNTRIYQKFIVYGRKLFLIILMHGADSSFPFDQGKKNRFEDESRAVEAS